MTQSPDLAVRAHPPDTRRNPHDEKDIHPIELPTEPRGRAKMETQKTKKKKRGERLLSHGRASRHMISYIFCDSDLPIALIPQPTLVLTSYRVQFQRSRNSGGSPTHPVMYCIPLSPPSRLKGWSLDGHALWVWIVKVSAIVCTDDAAASRTYSSTPVTVSHGHGSVRPVRLHSSRHPVRQRIPFAYVACDTQFPGDIRGNLSMFTPASGSGFITAAAYIKYIIFKTIKHNARLVFRSKPCRPQAVRPQSDAVSHPSPKCRPHSREAKRGGCIIGYDGWRCARGVAGNVTLTTWTVQFSA